MRRLAIFTLIPLLLLGCVAERPPVVAEVITPMPYVRVTNTDSNVVQLQIAVRRFVPLNSRGPAVWLVGAAHLGDPDYYHALQQLLDAQTLVLFEGIGPHPQPGAAAPPPPVDTNADRVDLGSFQASAAESLGLVFQLDAIDYHRANFRNSDLTVQELQQLLAAPAGGESAAQGQFDKLISVMQGGTFLNTLLNTALRFIGADERLRGAARLALIEMVGGLRGDLSQLQGVSPDLQHLLKTLIDSRNQKVMRDLQLALQEVPRKGSIAIFYGTGHMDNFEKRLCTDLHYRPVLEEWFTAFSVNLAQSGVTPAEADAIRGFARKQMEKLQPPPRSETGN